MPCHVEMTANPRITHRNHEPRCTMNISAKKTPKPTNNVAAIKCSRGVGARNQAGSAKSDVWSGGGNGVRLSFTAATEAITKARVGFEPTNNGFAIRPLRPLGHLAGVAQRYRGSAPSSSATRDLQPQAAEHRRIPLPSPPAARITSSTCGA